MIKNTCSVLRLWHSWSGSKHFLPHSLESFPTPNAHCCTVNTWSPYSRSRCLRSVVQYAAEQADRGVSKVPLKQRPIHTQLALPKKRTQCRALVEWNIQDDSRIIGFAVCRRKMLLWMVTAVNRSSKSYSRIHQRASLLFHDFHITERV